VSRPDLREATPAALVAAELGVACAGLGTVLGFSRLFVGWDYFGPLAIAVAAAWAVAVVTRRVGLGVGWSGAISALGAVLVLTWVFVPDTTLVGVPTPASASALIDEMRASFTDFSSLVAPVRVTDGFLIVLAGVMWAFTYFADTAAFRYRGPVQAVIPYASAFIATGVLARDVGRAGAALAFLAGMGIYAVTQRALVTSERRWIRGEAVRGTWAVASGAALAVAVALVVGLVAGPWLPGDAEAVVDLRSLGREGGARTVVSPYVGVRNLLGQQSDQIVFRVRSDVPAYWRLTALAQYDTSRDIWVSRGSYQEVDGTELARAPRGIPTERVQQAFTIEGLGGPWLPAAYEPSRMQIDADISFDEVTGSVITRSDSVESGTEYAVTSQVSALSPTELGGSRAGDPVDPEYLDDAGVSASVARTARRVTQGAPTPYQKMMALQAYFRNGFTYDTDVDYREDADPVAAFLDERRGFCQQFASTFALMARSVGLPARVAVGFTQGDAVSTETDDPDASAGTEFVVRGRHAHTWPEVHFDGIGWVAFEPTTGRGNPQAESYTGVAPEQAEPPPAQASTTTSPTTTTVAGDQAPSTTLPSGQLDTVAPETGEPAGEPGAGWGRWALVAVAVALVALLGATVVRRRRRFASLRDDPMGGRIAVAWQRTLEDLATVGIEPRASETPFELARRVAASDIFDAIDAERREAADRVGAGGVPSGDGTAAADRSAPGHAADAPPEFDQAGADATPIAEVVAQLAWQETSRRYGRVVPDEADCRDAEAAAAQVHRAVRTVATTRQKVRHLVG
jgi:transglutaminase-like putative cysteine protease